MIAVGEIKIRKVTVTLSQFDGDSRIDSFDVPLPTWGDTFELVEVSFHPSQLRVLDINEWRDRIASKHHVSGGALEQLLPPLLRDVDGLRAVDITRFPPFDFYAIQVAFGGIYYADERHPQYRTRQASGFVSLNGIVFSEDIEHFTQGGYLLFPYAGSPELIRTKFISHEDKMSPRQICDHQKQQCQPLNNYRLILQSKPVLVMDGKPEGDNNNNFRERRAAIAAYSADLASFVVTEEEVTLREFSFLLANLGVPLALNLDGKKSAQMVERRPNGSLHVWVGGEGADRMPQVYAIMDAAQ
ncbi:MAG: hypothetical protein A3I05_09700 [Deltaproteobacteria bacterium RIFCSPLOWO2_02_FULL_44_10]|nr:MAG: hypothetical protein A3C46_06480 [Deltaproteobacteria bacterium RIFCSPHIGHO2_02_FULL_44_16]OGQ46472.1 MAG: hypothetical protein A3I05_09700 [Deltaproteobacteria bacterium RIFCSPLOWO2_02_FULL_44_10]